MSGRLVTGGLIAGSAVSTAESGSGSNMGLRRHYECKCLHNAMEDDSLCYGFVIGIEKDKMSFYEGDSGGEGKYRFTRIIKGLLFVGSITTGTGQKERVLAIRKPNGKTLVYSNAISEDPDFVAVCK